MWWIIGGIIVVVVGIFTLGFSKAAGKSERKLDYIDVYELNLHKDN